MTVLYHYTCEHGMLAILGDDRRLRPTPQVALPGCPPLLWCTTQARPDPEALGLTSYTLACDRTQHRFRLDDPGAAVPWVEWLRYQPREMRRTARLVLTGSPLLWWVATVPVRAHLTGEPNG